MSFVSITKGNRHILYDAELFDDPEEIAFDSTVWAQRDAIIGFAEGRGTTFFVNHRDISLALRHYHRGGLISRYLPDRYLWIGLRQTRAWRELNLLQRMRDLGLPVPRPVAAQVVRDGMYYTADIMTCRIPDARTLAQMLTQQPFEVTRWQAIGRLIRNFHDQGVYHADLNANNIMLDASENYYLIDFDRGSFRRRHRGWQQSNLKRLRRSLEKLKRANETFYFEDSDWQHLLKGYQEAQT